MKPGALETLQGAIGTLGPYTQNPELLWHTIVPFFTEQEEGFLDIVRIFLAGVFGPTSAF